MSEKTLNRGFRFPDSGASADGIAEVFKVPNRVQCCLRFPRRTEIRPATSILSPCNSGSRQDGGVRLGRP